MQGRRQIHGLEQHLEGHIKGIIALYPDIHAPAELPKIVMRKGHPGVTHLKDIFYGQIGVFLIDFGHPSPQLSANLPAGVVFLLLIMTKKPVEYL